MGKKQQITYSVVENFLAGRVTRKEASELLQVRERTISRIARRIETKKFMGVIHGNTGRRSNNRGSEDLRRDVMGLVKSRYFDFNMTHALEVLKKDHALIVAYTTFRRWCVDLELVKRRKRRQGKVRRVQIGRAHV